MTAVDNLEEESRLIESQWARILLYTALGILAWYILFHKIFMNHCICRKVAWSGGKKKKWEIAKPRFPEEDDFWSLRSAHRGGAMERTENTLEAFENALSHNIQFLECDVHLTKDNVVVIAHDYDLTRICHLDPAIHGTRKFIGEFDFSELPRFRRLFSTGVYSELKFEHPLEENPSKFCKLEDLFALCNSDPKYANSWVNIDMKSAPRSLMKADSSLTEEQVFLIFRRKVDLVKKLIEQFKMEERVFWVSANSKEAAILKEPPYLHINRCFNASTIFKMMAMYMLGLLWIMPIRDHHYTVPFLSLESYANLKKFMADNGITNPVFRFLLWFIKVFTRNSKQYFQHLKKRGCVVTIWALNSETEFEEAYRIFGGNKDGALDGVMTDYPERLASYCRRVSGMYLEEGGEVEIGSPSDFKRA